MKETVATDDHTCEFCNRTFRRPTTLFKHICEYKHRWLEKDKQSNRLGFQAWLQFYNKNTASKKNRTYVEFIKSPYYTAFLKFGTYCSEVNVINVSRYIDWLLKNKIKIDVWNTDSNYTKYLVEYLRDEDAFDAISRSVITTNDMAEKEGILCKDVLRFVNKNRICLAITTGKISPWMLYQSKSGKEFLGDLDESQAKLIMDYINPELWAVKFHRNPEVAIQIKDILDTAGY